MKRPAEKLPMERIVVLEIQTTWKKGRLSICVAQAMKSAAVVWYSTKLRLVAFGVCMSSDAAAGR